VLTRLLARRLPTTDDFVKRKALVAKLAGGDSEEGCPRFGPQPQA
jgi:hypothetical protein